MADIHSTPIYRFDEEIKPACEFDEAILSAWLNLHDKQPDLFRSSIRETRLKHLGGDNGLIIQYNPRHYSKKRKQSSPSCSHPAPSIHSPPKFNFNMVPSGEYLGHISFGDGKEHPILINVSPLSAGHVLMVPNAEDCLPQILSPGASRLVMYAITFACMSARSG